MLIDIHSHPVLTCWRDALRNASPSGDTLYKDGIVLPEWSPSLAIEAMDANEIDAMVLSAPSGAAVAGVPGTAALARAMNEEIAGIVQRHPRRFGALAVLPMTDMDEALAEMRYALDDLGFDGVCLQTNAAGFYPGDATFAPLFAELDRRRAVAFVHPDTPAFNDAIALPFNSSILEFTFDTTRAIVSMIFSGMRARYPNFAYVATHAGGTIPFLADRLGVAGRVMPTGYGLELSPADIAATLRTLHFDLTAATSPVALTALLSITGTDRLLAGFDFPFMPSSTIAPARGAIDASPLLTDEDRAAIYGGNALALLPALRVRIGMPA